MTLLRRHVFVLAIYLSTRGFAFVLFEGALSPVDWAVKEERGRQKNRKCLDVIRDLLDRYLPGVLVLQDTSPKGTRRARRIRRLNASIFELAEVLGIPTIVYSRIEVL